MVSVDPGLNTGVAVWQDDKLLNSFVIRCQKQFCGVDRLYAMYDLFATALESIKELGLVYIEGVRSFASARSWASSTRGNLALLAYIVGGYTRICQQEYDIGVYIIDPKWKGQLSTHALEARIHRAGITMHLREHEREAIGLGLSVMGRL